MFMRYFLKYLKKEKQTSKKTMVLIEIEVPSSEYWRLFLCPVMCILPPPKYIRVKNKMAEDGWRFMGERDSSWNGFTTLLFQKE